ncbi:hypothetical protein CVT26_001366 [Gymnopilus dilepis]|uniref:Proteophosphoglycan 5 n=1 Tax=Gymnopilus dilepis TaxID=231916 RepID=A0A409YUK0_9AGAR|nr:hypothetical protein CVT26_001366 [Gymnopilus dilepis]
MLRARSKTGEAIDWSSPKLSSQEQGRFSGGDMLDDPVLHSKVRKRGTASRTWISRTWSRAFGAKLCLGCFSLVLLATVFLTWKAYMRVDPHEELISTSDNGTVDQLAAHDSGTELLETYLGLEVEGNTTAHAKDSPATTATAAPTRTKAPYKYPKVDRSILAKLDRLERFFADDYGLSPPMPTPKRHGPPLITGIPEPRRAPRSSKRGNRGGGSSPGKDTPSSANANAICESPAHPRPCRFLLPLRVAEQESKARIHLSQIAQLARQLNRTLVLPNVGKSKIGACFKWPFSTYYEPSSLLLDKAVDPSDLEAFVELEAFRSWWDTREKHGRVPVNSQLISVAPTLPAHDSFREHPLYGNGDIEVHAYKVFGAWNSDLPGCVGSKFRPLGPALPVFMSANIVTTKEGGVRPIGDAVLDAFNTVLKRRLPRPAEESFLEQDVINNVEDVEVAEPDVVVVNWDLRHPVFPPSPNVQTLQYSARMHELAKRYAPKDPYLAIHWRMETVDPETLQECAHALVDVLTRLLHDDTLAENLTTIWFASDYPYPIARRTAKNKRPAVAAKSGTFRDFDIRHEEAVEVIRSAFDQNSELEGWRLTDFAEAIEDAPPADRDLLGDPGVLGILDKIVSTKANLFVSGSTRCARKRYVAPMDGVQSLKSHCISSFTRQVIESRRNDWAKNRQSHVRNVVDMFG